jgi:DNA-binding CsgD family transcriptional regulator
MTRETIATANAFANLFPKNEPEQHTCFKAESNRDVILQNLRFAEQIYPNSAITMCPVSHPNMSYFSSNAGDILGHPQKELESLPLQDFMGLAHADDLPHIRQCFAFIKQLEPYDPTMHRFVLHYRIRNAAGGYVPMRNENIALQTGDAYLYLMLFTQAPPETRFHHVTLEISKKIKGRFRKIRTYTPRQEGQEITPRQRTIASLIAQGFSNQQIATQLHVSVYTVKNHKQMLFRKVNVKSSMELAHYIRNESASS